MVVVEWTGWAWPGWTALVGIGTLALAGVTVWVWVFERRRTAEQRRYERLVEASAHLRAVIGVIPVMRAGLMLEATPPPVLISLFYRLGGRPWPMGISSLTATIDTLAKARSSMTLIRPLLDKAGRLAADEYERSINLMRDAPGDRETMNRTIGAAETLADHIDRSARRLM